MTNLEETSEPIGAAERDLSELLHPAQAFAHPQSVVDDPGLTLNEKRAILAAWASDACAVEAPPALRQAPGSVRAVSVDEILEALRLLDRQFASVASPSRRRPQRRASIEAFRSRRAGAAGGLEPRPNG
jgi:hypothetical protein